MNTDIFMSKEEIVETLNDFVFGNFEIPMKVKTAINEAVCMLESRDETIDRVLEIIDDADKKAGDKTYIVLDDGSFYSQVKYIKEKILKFMEE